MGEAKRRQIVRQRVFQAAKLISSADMVLPRGGSEGAAPWLECYETSRVYAERHGGSMVFGFIVEALEGGPQVAEFQHHAVVRMADGTMIDPTYRPHRAPVFLPDPQRPYDTVNHMRWNHIAVFSQSYHCPISRQQIPAWTIAACATVNRQSCYSLDPRHFRSKHFEEGDDYVSYLQSLGLDADNPVDMAFATDIETIYIAVDDPDNPPERIKDFKLRGAKLDVSSGLRPVDPAQVLTMAEEEQIGLARRDGR